MNKEELKQIIKEEVIEFQNIKSLEEKKRNLELKIKVLNENKSISLNENFLTDKMDLFKEKAKAVIGILGDDLTSAIIKKVELLIKKPISEMSFKDVNLSNAKALSSSVGTLNEELNDDFKKGMKTIYNFLKKGGLLAVVLGTAPQSTVLAVIGMIALLVAFLLKTKTQIVD